MIWEEQIETIRDLLKNGKTNKEIAKHFSVSEKTIQNQLGNLRRKGFLPRTTRQSVEAQTPNNEEIIINNDGSYSSSKPLWMTLENITNPAYLLKAHGFNSADWELVNAKNNRWNAYSKKDGVQVLYASKITVKPKTESKEFTYKDLINEIKSVHPVHISIEPFTTPEERMLEIPMFDMHFGISDFSHYANTLSKVHHHLTKRKWTEVLFIIGQDLFHNDNFKGTTANGTVIEKVDMRETWNHACQFYYPLIETAIMQGKSVTVKYAKGNHDESMSWAFVKTLEAIFKQNPNICFDDTIDERKVHVFGRNFIGITHGDKARKDLMQLFPAEFPMEWSQTRYREIHMGHLHKEDGFTGKDSFGMMVRTLSTRNKTDSWHKDNGFTTAHKRFMLFDYSVDELESIYYV